MPERLNARTPERRLSRLDGLALACALLWSAGAALTPLIGMWDAVGGTAIGLGIVSLALAHRSLMPLLQPSRRLLVVGAVAAGVMIAATYGLYPLVGRGFVALASQVSALYAILRAAQPFWVRGALLPIMIISEELVWRGVVMTALCRRFSPTAAVLIGAAVYAAAHLPAGSLLLGMIALACGLFWSALRVWTGSVIPGLLSHLAWDFLVFLFYPLT
jgi:membrane protease YdiL (CAAX protease family)